MNLRQRIIRKLMRPEDGYLYTGSCFRFYVSDDGTYLVGMIDEHYTHYFALTLTGWREFEWESEPPKEICFSQWTAGIVQNVYDEYNARMESLTRRDFNLKKRKDGEPLMLNKQSFCDIMSALDVYWANVHKLGNVLNVIFENNALTQVMEAVMDALEEDLEPNLTLDDEPLLYHWMWNLDCGRDPMAKYGMEDGWPLTTAEELYDYLVWKRDGEANVEEV